MKTNRAVFGAVTLLLMCLVPAGADGRSTIDRTIAKVNDDLLTESDLAEVCADAEGRFRVSPQDGFAIATTETVQSMFDRTLLKQEARRRQINPTADEMNLQVEDMVREIRSSFASEKEFHQALVSERISLAQLKDELLEKSKTDFMVYHVINSRYSVSEQEISQFEAERASRGERTVSYRLRRLGIPINKNGEQEASRQARDVVARIIKEGISFEEGVRKYSQVPGAAQDGGDMGYMSSDKLSGNVIAAIENLETGHASKPVVAGGYANIFYLEGKRGAKSAVREQKFFEAREGLMSELRRKAYLQVYDDRLLKLMPADYLPVCKAMVARTGAGSNGAVTSGAKATSAPVSHQQYQPVVQPQATPRPAGGLRRLFGRQR